MFRTHLLSTIRSLDNVFTATGICCTIYDDCLLADSRHKSVNRNNMTNTNCCEYGKKTPDVGQ